MYSSLRGTILQYCAVGYRYTCAPSILQYCTCEDSTCTHYSSTYTCTYTCTCTCTYSSSLSVAYIYATRVLHVYILQYTCTEGRTSFFRTEYTCTILGVGGTVPYGVGLSHSRPTLVAHTAGTTWSLDLGMHLGTSVRTRGRTEHASIHLHELELTSTTLTTSRKKKRDPDEETRKQ